VSGVGILLGLNSFQNIYLFKAIVDANDDITVSLIERMSAEILHSLEHQEIILSNIRSQQ
jgi:hypothetical protein